MKKLFSLVIAFALCLSAGTAAFAATVETDGGTQNIDVRAKYVDGADAPVVYHADITWGAMEFTYTVSGTKIWNTDTYKYTVGTKGEWTANGNDINVTNHSNVGINAEFAYAQESGYENVSGSFSQSELSLPTAEGKFKGDTGLTKKTELTLGGRLDGNKSEFTKVGTVTVTISRLNSVIEDENQLAAALRSSGNYTLSHDISATGRLSLVYQPGNLELDLCGNTVTRVDQSDVLIYANKANATIKNGNLYREGDAEEPVFYITDDVNLTLENCTLKADNRYAIEMVWITNTASVTLIDCTVTGNDTLGAISVDHKQKLIFGGNTVVNGKIKSVPTSEIVCLDGTYNFDPSAYVDENRYTVSVSNGIWTVTAK